MIYITLRGALRFLSERSMHSRRKTPPAWTEGWWWAEWKAEAVLTRSMCLSKCWSFSNLRAPV